MKAEPRRSPAASSLPSLAAAAGGFAGPGLCDSTANVALKIVPGGRVPACPAGFSGMEMERDVCV